MCFLNILLFQIFGNFLGVHHGADPGESGRCIASHLYSHSRSPSDKKVLLATPYSSVV